MQLPTFKRLVMSALMCVPLCWPAGSPVAGAQKRAGGRAQVGARVRRGNATAEAEGVRASKYVEEGLRHADAGEWAEAIKSYRHALVDDPQDVEAYLNLGDAYLSVGNDREAVAAYQQAVRLAPKRADAYYALGAAYNFMGQHSDAFKPLVQAIRLAPNYAEAYYGIGYAYQNLDNFKDAVGHLRTALRLKPEYPEAHLSLGLSYVGLGDVRAAEAQLKLLEGEDAALAQTLARALQQAAAAARAQAPAERSERATAPGTGGVRMEASKRVASGVAPTSQVADAAALLAVELSFWESIKNSTAPEEYAAYLNKYPAGQFADLARIRLRTLEGRSSAGAQTAEAVKEPMPAPPASMPASNPTPSNMPGSSAQPSSAPSNDAPANSAPPSSVQPDELENPKTLEETLDWIRRYLPNSFTYRYTTPGEAPDAPLITQDAKVTYELLRFEGCQLEWRDSGDTLSVSLSELDPASVKVELRQRPDTTFNPQVWQVSINATGGRGAFRELKGDGSGTEKTYTGVDLQYADQGRAARLARALQHAIKLCGGKTGP